ncbi:MAG: SDR family NAD(P)-dependent oxidoreductase [Chitinophagales bacterium]
MNQRKIIFITGATAGIGEATALLFAQNGWDLILTGRRKERLDSVAQKIEATYGVNVLPLTFDVRDNTAVQDTITNLPKKWRTIDVLVNNAGLAMGKSSFEEANIEDWEIMIDTNIKGLLYVSRLISPMMIQNGKGHIINLSSTAGSQVYAGGHVYCATKHAVEALSQAMRIDLLKHGIKVTSIQPGMVETEFSVVRFKGNKEQADDVYKNLTPLVAEDVAETIYFAATRPAHVNINEIMLTCTAQANSFYVHRKH